MAKPILGNKPWIVLMLILALSLSCSNAFAWWEWGYHHPRGYHWYRGHWWLGGAIVTGLTVGAIIATLPPHYSVIYVGGVPYYYDGAYYYRTCPGGYVVVTNPTVVVPAVPRPVAVLTAQAPVLAVSPAASNTITINVPNSRGGFTPVLLTKKGNGYIGPQGEYYKGHPTVEQLKVLYGK